MSAVINRRYLYKRFGTVSGLSILALVVIIGLCWRAVVQMETTDRYNRAFTYMLDNLRQLETEVARAGLRAHSGRGTDMGSVEMIFDRLLGIYGALRLSNPATDEPSIGDDFETRLSYAMLDLTRLGDIEAVAQRFALVAGEMPEPLYRNWRAGPDGSPSLEDGLGELLVQIAMAFTARGGLSESDIESLLSRELPMLQPQVESLTALLLAESERRRSALRPALTLIVVVGLLVAIAIWLLIFRPMTVTITESQAEITRERDRAVHAEHAKGEFLAVMSHELRTPMNAVIGFANLLGQSQLNGLQREFVETIQSSGETLLALLNDILDFSKIEAGKIDLEDVELSIEEVLDGILDLFGPTAYAKGLELSSYIDPDMPAQVIGDPARLRQIMFNLVGNAVKFTCEGAVSIEIRRHDERFEIAVVDTGIGIAADKLDQIFERFSQADTSTARRYGGTGLGLAIARRLAELMGGELSADSELGRGSTFRVGLPLRHTDPPAEVLACQSAADIAGRRVLVVDDNAVNLRVFTLLLEAYGAEPDTAEDAHVAMSVLLAAVRGGRPFEVAVIDHMMPDVDGLQLAAMIRAEPSLAGLRLVLSSSAHLASGEMQTDAGFDARCPKPVRQAALLTCIDAVLRGAPATLPKQAVPARPPAPGPDQPADEAGGIRLLIAEDNSTNQRLLAAILAGKGYAIDMVGNGAEAVQQARQLPYDVMLLDVAMPEMNGLEATERIRRSRGRNADTPIIAITANALKGDRETCLAAGMDDYLAKPIDPDLLLEKLAYWAEHGRNAAVRTGT